MRPDSLNYYFSHLCESICIIAVNVFIIIIGYFSYKKNFIVVSKAVKLALIMIFWGIILSLVSVYLLLPQEVTVGIIKQILKESLTQWFVVIYIILYLLIPFLNKLINSNSQFELKILILIGIFSFYIIGTVSTVTISDNGYGIINFINLYFIGAYIHKYNNNNIKFRLSISIYFIMFSVTTLFSFVTERAWAYNTIFNLIGSVAFFEAFKSIDIGYNKVINKLATFTFSVYLIDTNKFFNKFLYHSLFHCNNYWNNFSIVINFIISVIGIYIICIVLDSIRILTLGSLFDSSSNLFNYHIKIK